MPDRIDLQFVHAGPAYAAVVRLGIEQPGQPRVGRRVVLCIVATWVVLLVLALAQGVAVGHRVAVPFLKDFDAPAKFLLSLPLLLWAEVVAARRLGPAVDHFVAAGLIAETDQPRYRALMDRARRLRDAWLPELIILVLCGLSSVAAFRVFEVGNVTDWRVINRATHQLSWAGWWLLLVAGPFYRFILYRWLWRFAIWTWFLWRTSRLELRLVPAHPDRAGGLGFLGRAELAFSLVATACCIVLAADLGFAVVHLGMTSAELRRIVAALILLFTLMQLLPLLPWIRALSRAHYRGLLEHGALVSRHHRAFEAKWIAGARPDAELLGMDDAGSLADLPSGLEAAQVMGFVPVDRQLLISYFAAAALPFAPLLLVYVSLAEVGRQLLQLAL